MSKASSKERFQNVCPRRLTELPDADCSLGRERMACVSGGLPDDTGTPGCPWWIASGEDHYCFWVHTSNHPEPHSLKDIANLLLIAKQDDVKDLHEQAIKKLKVLLSGRFMSETREMLESASTEPEGYNDPSIYVRPVESYEPTAHVEEDPMDRPRSKKRVQMFGLYTRKDRPK